MYFQILYVQKFLYDQYFKLYQAQLSTLSFTFYRLSFSKMRYVIDKHFQVLVISEFA